MLLFHKKTQCFRTRWCFFFFLFRDSETFQKSLSAECRDHQNYGRTICAQIVQKRSRASSSLSALLAQVVFRPRSLSSYPFRMSRHFPFCSAVHNMSPFFIFSTHRQYLNNCSSHGEHEQSSSWETYDFNAQSSPFCVSQGCAVQRTFFFFSFFFNSVLHRFSQVPIWLENMQSVRVQVTPHGWIFTTALSCTQTKSHIGVVYLSAHSLFWIFTLPESHWTAWDYDLRSVSQRVWCPSALRSSEVPLLVIYPGWFVLLSCDFSL